MPTIARMLRDGMAGKDSFFDVSDYVISSGLRCTVSSISVTTLDRHRRAPDRGSKDSGAAAQR